MMKSNNLLYSVAVALVAVVGMQANASAGTFHWGDFVGTNVMFLDVTENNDEADSLFAPTPGTGGPVVLGNSLHLAPQGFGSQAENGEADIIDSTLSTIIMAGPGSSLDEVTITELGDYSLGGISGAAASAQVGAAFFWTVLEVNNSPVSLATQATNLITSTGSGPNGGIYSRPSDDGTAVIWNGIANIDLGGYLASEQIDGEVTKLRLTFDNTLQTAAEQGSAAFIKKKSVDIVVTPNVPEPATVLLLGLATACVPCLRRRASAS